MSSGLPDWILALNVDGQQDGYLKQRPSYGGAQRSLFNTTIANGINSNIVSITGIGQTYGGFIKASAAATFKNSIVTVRVDTIIIFSASLAVLNSMNAVRLNQGFVILSQFDDVNFVYGISYTFGFTFESSLSVNWASQSSGDVLVNSNFNYALV